MPQSSKNEVFGYGTPQDWHSDSAAFNFIIKNSLAEIQTMTLVKVVSVSNQGGVTPVGFVDVQPLVHMLTGDGKTVECGRVNRVPYFRLQGGANAIILDPQVGDIGMCGFCSRDISSVKNNKKASAPQSLRRFDFADGLYFGGFLNGAPLQYIQFSDGGITVHSPTKIELSAPEIKFSGNTETTGTSSTAGNASFGASLENKGVNVGSTHTHSGVESGSKSTGNPS